MPPAAVDINGTLQSSALVLNVKTDGMGTSPATGTLSLPLSFSASGVPRPRRWTSRVPATSTGRARWRRCGGSCRSPTPASPGKAPSMPRCPARCPLPSFPRRSRSKRPPSKRSFSASPCPTSTLMRLSSPEGCPVCPFPLRTGRAARSTSTEPSVRWRPACPFRCMGRSRSLPRCTGNDLSVTLSGTADIVGPGDVARCARGHHRQ